MAGVDLPAAVRTFPVYELAFREERFAVRTIEALIGALVDVALVVELLENFLDFLFMILVGGADKVVIGYIHQVKLSLDDAGNFVHKLF